MYVFYGVGYGITSLTCVRIGVRERGRKCVKEWEMRGDRDRYRDTERERDRERDRHTHAETETRAVKRQIF